MGILPRRPTSLMAQACHPGKAVRTSRSGAPRPAKLCFAGPVLTQGWHPCQPLRPLQSMFCIALRANGAHQRSTFCAAARAR